MGTGDLASGLVISNRMVIELVDGCSLFNRALDGLGGGVEGVIW